MIGTHPDTQGFGNVLVLIPVDFQQSYVRVVSANLTQLQTHYHHSELLQVAQLLRGAYVSTFFRLSSII